VHLSPFTRRQFLCASAAAAFANLAPRISLAQNPTGKRLHGISAFGELKYAADYTHFEDAALDAPKGGRFSFSPSNWAFNQNTSTFNTLNSFVLKGDAPPRMELCFDTLMTGSPDEPDSLYCATAKWIEIAPDRNTYRFGLRPEARFHDGSPLTAQDVVFSYETLKEKGHPSLFQVMKELVSVSALDTGTVELTFSGKQSDRAILSAVGLPIFSKAYQADKPIDGSTLVAPLSSGPWKVGRMSAGRFIEYDRVQDYWAKDMPFAKGFNHFDTLRIDFFRDRLAPFEAFKKGDITWREEFTSKVWATEYDFPAVQQGRVVKREIPGEPVANLQGWAINMRREKFADPRTREAIGLCFDFEWTNRNLFYDSYTRASSLFEQSQFKASGDPSKTELALLEPYKDSLPQAAFGAPWEPRKTDGSGNNRQSLRKAFGLLKDAGWRREGARLVNQQGEILTIEFLIRAPVFQRVLGNFVTNLKQLNIDATIRLVDPAQFTSRLNDFDFDVVGARFNLGTTPTEEAMQFLLGSDFADLPGSRNYPGIRSSAVDGLITQLKTVGNRDELVTILRALDRVVRPIHAWIPNWYADGHRVAHWDMFGWREPKPEYSFSPETTWWFDEQKATAIGKA